ncbi:hypothetical protein [Paraburkholderia sp. J67]|uniref:hypothetical protein n=1 Tax=Paraburkholderia sp. J67 TaxID=2805435 RepID=UPI002ABE8948|nr:hypothetical protein [Paraburkholderia sp. J67]
MTTRHIARARNTRAITGLALGIASAATGAGLWLGAGTADQSMAMPAILLGVFLAIYAGHEVLRGRTR